MAMNASKAFQMISIFEFDEPSKVISLGSTERKRLQKRMVSTHNGSSTAIRSS